MITAKKPLPESFVKIFLVESLNIFMSGAHPGQNVIGSVLVLSMETVGIRSVNPDFIICSVLSCTMNCSILGK